MNRFKLLLSIMLLTIGLSVHSLGWHGPGNPLNADLKVSCSSTGPWFDGPVTICPCTKLYFYDDYINYDIDIAYGTYYGYDEVKPYMIDFGDGYTSTFSAITHQYNTTTSSIYNAVIEIDDYAVYYDDPMAVDTVQVNVIPVVNPMVTSNTYQYDLTHQLPFCGTFAFGTIGGYVSCSAGGSVTSNLGNVQLNVSSAGGSSEINLLHDTPIDLRKTTIPVDVVNVLVQFRTSPEVCSGGEFEVFVSGDTTTHKLPVRSSIKFGAQNSYIQPAGKTDYMIFVLNVLPQDFTKLNELVIRYTTPGGVESYINLEQVYLWVERRYL